MQSLKFPHIFLQIFKGHGKFHMKIKGNKQSRIAKAMMDNERTTCNVIIPDLKLYYKDKQKIHTIGT